MCGILAVVGSKPMDPAFVGSARWDACMESLGRRGPDGSGQWISGCGHAAMGHTRLAIVDPSERGRQPMVDESERFAMPESLRGVDAHLLDVLGVELVRSQRRLTPKSLFARARSSRDDGCVAAQIAARDACHYVFQLHYRRHLEGRKRWPSKNQRRDYWASSMELASKLLFAVWPPQTGADNGDVKHRQVRILRSPHPFLREYVQPPASGTAPGRLCYRP